MKIKLHFVSDEYRRDATDGFQSRQVVKMGADGRGHQGIVAQVTIPTNLPRFGSPSLVGFPIEVRVSERCAQHPQTFISVMAHELSHIRLYSIWHKDKDSEVHTDLTALILGFSEVTSIGRSVVTRTTTGNAIHTETTTYGYLSTDNFTYARNRINSLLVEKRKIREHLLAHIKKTLTTQRTTERTVASLPEYLKYVDQHQRQRFTLADGEQICAFHQPGYWDGHLSVLKDCEIRRSEIYQIVSKTRFYSDQVMDSFRQSEKNLAVIDNELEILMYSLNRDAKTLRVYVGFWYRFGEIIRLTRFKIAGLLGRQNVNTGSSFPR